MNVPPNRLPSLLPCPFCGMAGRLSTVRGGHRVVCTGCFAAGAPAYHGTPPSTEGAANEWNARAANADRDRLARELEEAREALGSQAASDVLTERRRQVEAEGWTAAHDDMNDTGEMATAAAAYALAATGFRKQAVMEFWPKKWSSLWFKSTTSRRDLVKAGALIVAEIERLDRAALKGDA